MDRRRLTVIAAFGAFSVWACFVASAGAQTGSSPAPLTAAQQARLREATDAVNRADELYRQGKPREALPHAKQALAIRLEILGPQHAHTAIAQNNLAAVYYGLGDLKQAKLYFSQALATNRKLLGDNRHETAQALNNLGYILFQLGEFKAARAHMEKALSIWQKVRGPRHADTALAQNNLGILYQALGEYALARKALEQTLSIRQQSLGERDQLTAAAYNNLGCLLEELGDYPGARANYERALALRLELLGEMHPETATSLNNLGSLLGTQGDLSAARGYYERALAVRKKILPSRHRELAISFNNLGSLLQRTAEFDAARQNYEQALAIWSATLGEDHPLTATAIHNLATAMVNEGNAAAAIPQFERAMAIREKTLGKDHPDRAVSLNMLAAAQLAAGDAGAARRNYEAALAIWDKVQTADHPNAFETLNQLAALDAAAGDWPAATERFHAARRSSRRHAARVLPALSEVEQLAFLKHADASFLHSALSLGRLRGDDPAICAASAAWLINGKAVGQEALVQRTLLVRDSRRPELAPTVNELLQTRRRLAALTLSFPQPGEEEKRRAEIAKLQETERTLSRQLARTDASTVDPWVELDTVRAGVPDDAVLIDIARVDTVAFGQDSAREDARYVAWIIPPTSAGDVQLVDLGAADALDALVEEMRAAIRAGGRAPPLDRRAQGEAERGLRAVSAKLTEALLEPLAAAVGDVRRWIISPDGTLWLAPWAALALDDGRYAIEEYEFEYVVSGRDLAKAATPDGKPLNKPIVIADPDFDLAAEKAAEYTNRVLGRAAPLSDQRGQAGAGRSVLERVERLPGSAAEAAAVAPMFDAYAGAAPVVYTDRYALEGIFKAIARPRVLLVSTHGFFLPDQAVERLALGDGAGVEAAVAADGSPLENPLLRCGLLLAGCNRRGGATPAGEDGVLTGMEIVGTNLTGTEMVVLSACDTGVGQVNNGEGVAGLRQAFQLAGAQSVIATLWQIPDQESALLMTAFFAQIAEGKSKSAALRQAQVAVINSRRQQLGAAHPYYWAAYTLTGGVEPRSIDP